MTLVFLNFAGECYRYDIHAPMAPWAKRVGGRWFVRRGMEHRACTVYEEVCG